MSAKKTQLSRETPFTGGKSLLFSWTPLNKVCDMYGLETFGQFDDQFLKRNSGTFTRTEIIELLKIGLERKDQAGNTIPVPVDEINNLLDIYMDEGHVVTDVILLIIEAIYNGLIHKTTPPGEPRGETTPKIQTIQKEPLPI